MREFDGLSQVIKSIVQRGRKVRVPSQDEVNKSSSHPAKEKEKLKKCNQRKTNIYPYTLKQMSCDPYTLKQMSCECVLVFARPASGQFSLSLAGLFTHPLMM